MYMFQLNCLLEPDHVCCLGGLACHSRCVQLLVSFGSRTKWFKIIVILLFGWVNCRGWQPNTPNVHIWSVKLWNQIVLLCFYVPDDGAHIIQFTIVFFACFSTSRHDFSLYKSLNYFECFLFNNNGFSGVPCLSYSVVFCRQFIVVAVFCYESKCDRSPAKKKCDRS